MKKKTKNNYFQLFEIVIITLLFFNHSNNFRSNSQL